MINTTKQVATCPRCNNKFLCTPNDILNCQCSKITLDTQQRQYVAENYKGCLCYQCLMDVKKYFYANEVNPNIKTK